MATTRKKRVKTEILAADDPMPVTKTVEAKHTIEYREPMSVPVVEQEPEEDDLLLDEEENEEPQSIRKPTVPTIRQKLKAKLASSGIADDDQLALRVDRLPFYDADGRSGIKSEKEFCKVIPCKIDFILTDTYLNEVSRLFGAGVYWFTLRHKNSILQNWHHRVGGTPQVATASIPDPNTGQPQIIYQQQPPQNGQQQTNPLKFIRDSFSVVREFRDVLGLENASPQIVENPQPIQAPVPPDVQLASLLMADPDLKKKAIVNLLGTKDKETDYIALAIEHGPTIIDAIGKAIQAVVKEVKLPLANGANNVQTPMGKAQTPQRENVLHDNRWQNSLDLSTDDQSQLQQTNAQNTQILPQNTQEMANIGTDGQRVVTDPREELMRIAFEGCTRNDPPQVTAGQITAWAEYVETNYPTHSVWGWVDVFAGQTTEEIITLLQTGMLGESGKQIPSLPHAHKWIGELRELLKTEEEGESDE